MIMHMEQLLAHLVGDYMLQTDWMATQKTKKWYPAAVHAFFYTLSFFLLTNSALALFVIMVSHYFIDRYRLAVYFIFFKNKITSPHLRWSDCKETGFPKSRPISLSRILVIITDNTIHLLINFAALTWL
jgi:hypothetical protein